MRLRQLFRVPAGAREPLDDGPDGLVATAVDPDFEDQPGAVECGRCAPQRGTQTLPAGPVLPLHIAIVTYAHGVDTDLLNGVNHVCHGTL